MIPERITTMKEYWKERLSEWSKPPTAMEEKKGSAAAAMINDALRASPQLVSKNFKVYPTGSYRNNTNVRLNSDIDIAVVLMDSFYPALPQSLTREKLGIKDAIYCLTEFRKDVGDALERKFGSVAVDAGNITFNVRESSRRLDADVTPFLLHRQYTGELSQNRDWVFIEGVETRSRRDPSVRVINWHEQHYVNGVARNEETKHRFKRITRILKRLRNEIAADTEEIRSGIAKTPSFLIECLVYNAPDFCFNRSVDGYYEDVLQTLSYLAMLTSNDAVCRDLVEVSRLKPLFSPEQAWSREDARRFVTAAYLYLTKG
jgi:hypothetical protein